MQIQVKSFSSCSHQKEEKCHVRGVCVDVSGISLTQTLEFTQNGETKRIQVCRLERVVDERDRRRMATLLQADGKATVVVFPLTC